MREANSSETREQKAIDTTLDQRPNASLRGRRKRAATTANFRSHRNGPISPSREQPARGLLSVIGAINWDISIFEDRFARPGEEVPVRLVEEFSGGKGANVAVAEARMIGPRRVAFLGALGDDYLWSRQLTELRKEGVITDGMMRVERARSGRAYILVDADGRKTIHTHFGANDRISPHHLIRGVAASFISKTHTMIVMDPPTPVALTAAQSAASKGAKVIYSPGVRTQEGRPRLERVLEHSDYLVVDRLELMNMYQTRSEEEAFEQIKQSDSSLTVVATLGARGCVVARDGIMTPVGGIDLSAIGKKPVNTTGSGDAFLGVFASYLAMGYGPLEATNWANLAGALKATRYETRGSPRKDELERMMKRVERFKLAQLGLEERVF